MNLAKILVICFLSLESPHAGFPQSTGTPQAPDQGQTSPAAPPAPLPASPSGSGQNAASPAKPRKHHKKATSGCPDAPAAASPVPSKSEPAKPESTDAAQPAVAPPASAATGAQTSATKPCPPPKKVVKNGGSDEPTIELKGNTTSEQASQQRSTTEQINAETEENLKKVADRPLSPNQQEMVNQVKQFLDQSRKAVAGGDLQLGHNLAVKANLLSAELIKP